MHKVILLYSILACIVCNAQNITNGTELADNLTSRSRVVVDAFENASNRVHALIQEVSPAPDLSEYATTGAVAAVSNAVALKADKTRAALIPTYYTAPSVFYTGNWCYDLVEGRYIDDIVYDAVLTRACADGRVYWQGTASYQIEGEEGTFYAMVIVRLGVDGGGAIYDVGSAVNITDYARISTPEALNDDINWNGALTKTEYGFMYEDSYEVSVGGDAQLAAYDSGTESVVYDLDLTNAINGIAAQMDGKLSTTGGVVTGNIILPQTGGSGGKTTINGNGITAGMEGFTIDSSYDPLLLKGSSATINFPYIRLLSGWDSLRDGDGYTIPYLLNATNDFVRKNNGTANNLTVANLTVQGNFAATNNLMSKKGGNIDWLSIGTLNSVSPGSFCNGAYCDATYFSTGYGMYVHATNFWSFVYNGTAGTTGEHYGSHGNGTFNIYPVGGISGFYIGNTNLYDIITSVAGGGSGGDTDSSYIRTIGITNINQSVQYVNITDTTPSILSIQLPTDGRTKDWIVYVQCVTNVSITLPSATWWMADAAFTNDIPPSAHTALYFSQIADNIFSLGRVDMVEVTAP